MFFSLPIMWDGKYQVGRQGIGKQYQFFSSGNCYCLIQYLLPQNLTMESFFDPWTYKAYVRFIHPTIDKKNITQKKIWIDIYVKSEKGKIRIYIIINVVTCIQTLKKKLSRRECMQKNKSITNTSCKVTNPRALTRWDHTTYQFLKWKVIRQLWSRRFRPCEWASHFLLFTKNKNTCIQGPNSHIPRCIDFRHKV